MYVYVYVYVYVSSCFCDSSGGVKTKSSRERRTHKHVYVYCICICICICILTDRPVRRMTARLVRLTVQTAVATGRKPFRPCLVRRPGVWLQVRVLPLQGDQWRLWLCHRYLRRSNFQSPLDHLCGSWADPFSALCFPSQSLQARDRDKPSSRRRA